MENAIHATCAYNDIIVVKRAVAITESRSAQRECFLESASPSDDRSHLAAIFWVHNAGK